MNAEALKEVVKARQLAKSGKAKGIRCMAGLSQAEIAEALGVDRTTIHRWEAGERRPGADAALAYGRLLAALLS